MSKIDLHVFSGKSNKVYERIHDIIQKSYANFFADHVPELFEWVAGDDNSYDWDGTYGCYGMVSCAVALHHPFGPAGRLYYSIGPVVGLECDNLTEKEGERRAVSELIEQHNEHWIVKYKRS